jgi:uncharacterized membrane protein
MNSSPTTSRSLVFAFLLIALIGFVDAVYLTASHYSGITPPCFITQGCDVVTTSAYSKILGVPVALLGVVFYLTNLILALIFLDKKTVSIPKILPWFTAIGFLSTLWFLYAQLFIIKSLCSYCLISAATSTLLFILAIFMNMKAKHYQTETT